MCFNRIPSWKLTTDLLTKDNLRKLMGLILVPLISHEVLLRSQNQ